MGNRIFGTERSLGKRDNDRASVERRAGKHPVDDREARRAAALRANLRKRKAQERARRDEEDPDFD